MLGVLAHPNEVETEVGLEPLLAEIERDERPTDKMGERGSDRGIEQRRPHQVAWNGKARTEQMERGGRGERPQDHHEGEQRHDRAEQPDADRQRAIDEHVDVLGDALVGIVGGIAEQLHAVVIGAGQPMIEVVLRHPAPPPDLQPLIEIELVDREHDIDRCQHAEKAELVDERVPIALLQRVIEAVVPLVEHDVDGHDRELDGDDRAQ